MAHPFMIDSLLKIFEDRDYFYSLNREAMKDIKRLVVEYEWVITHKQLS